MEEYDSVNNGFWRRLRRWLTTKSESRSIFFRGVILFSLFVLVLYLTYRNQRYEIADLYKALLEGALVAVIASVIIEFPGMTSIFRIGVGKELHEAISFNTDYIKGLKRDRLESVHLNLVKALNSANIDQNNSFYKIMRSKIEPLLGKVHYDRVRFEIDYHIENAPDNNNYWRVEREIIYDYHSRTAQQFDIGWEGRLLKMPFLETDKPVYELEYVEFDGDHIFQKPVEGKTVAAKKGVDYKPPYPDPEDNNYELISFSFPVQIKENEKLSVKRKEIARVPLNDFYRWKVKEGMSLRRLDIAYCTFDADVDPILSVYGLSDTGKKLLPHPEPRKCKIEWSGFMLPDHGIVISWSADKIKEIGAKC